MKIGYPCINRTLACQGTRTFRLASYSASRLEETIAGNLACLGEILRFNRDHGILFFRLSSDLVPFASHPVCRFPWKRRFASTFAALGRFIKHCGMRISMHPDQFTLINSLDGDIFRRSVRELDYHAAVLDLMGLSRQAKIQIHVGGVYGDKPKSIARFIERYHLLSCALRTRLVIENDDRLYTADDCLTISGETEVPVLFDVFHHQVHGNGAPVRDVLGRSAKTWRAIDGIPMVDYSSQKKGSRPGSHAESIDRGDFRRFLDGSRPYDIDIMLEIKDKEASALRAIGLATNDRRLVKR